MNLPVGTRFQSTDKLGNVNYYEVTHPNTLRAIGKTAEDCIACFEVDKRNNPETYFDKGSYLNMEVEPEWFNQRKIKVLEWSGDSEF